MSSLKAEKVANEILGNIGKGKRASVRAIAPKYGYSPSTANSGQIQKTESYQNVITPVVKRWIDLRDKLTSELESKNLEKENLRDITDTIDKLTKNIQLLTGGSTENVAIAGIEINVRKNS